MTDVLGYGGGRQTVAMCLLIGKGILPRPNRIVIADTGREVQSTWDYLTAYVQPYLSTFGLSVEIAPHSLSTTDLYALNGDLQLPVFTVTGKMPAFCSSEWKQRVCERYLRSVGITSATTWIGFTLDEKRRVKGFGQSPWIRSYPLIDLMLTRQDCEKIILDHGWSLPKKSRCWQCPHQTNEEWRELRDQSPSEFAQAVALDEEIREADDRGAVYLHQSRVPLALADLDAPDRREPVRQCGLGLCMV